MVINKPHETVNSYTLSKGIFDLDDKLDIILIFNNYQEGVMIKIYNEDGQIVKDFNKLYSFYDANPTFIQVYHDEVENVNKLIINSKADESRQVEAFTDVYTLPSRTLSLNENSTASSSLKIYPNPVTSVLTIDNPKNGVSEAKVYDMTGRLVKTSSFSTTDKSVTVNVSDLSKGNYVIKIGNSVSKIIKNYNNLNKNYMKKLFYLLTFATSSLLFGQIELEGTIDEKVNTYSSNGETFYVSAGYDINRIRIFDENFNLYKQFDVEIPEGNVRIRDTDNSEKPSAYILSKGIFDLDDKLDIIVFFEKENVNGGSVTYGQIIRIYNEDGEIVKQFDEYNYTDNIQINVFHNSKQNINKLSISGDGRETNDSRKSFTEIYTLPSRTLSLNENNTASSSLKIYPNPVTSVLTIDNPKNGVSEAKVFDMNGRLVKTSSFSATEKSVTVNVSDLSKGNYVIKIGNSVSKIIKN